MCTVAHVCHYAGWLADSLADGEQVTNRGRGHLPKPKPLPLKTQAHWTVPFRPRLQSGQQERQIAPRGLDQTGRGKSTRSNGKSTPMT
jgi:hypothetical protein